MLVKLGYIYTELELKLKDFSSLKMFSWTKALLSVGPPSTLKQDPSPREHLEEATSCGSWCDQGKTQGAMVQWPTGSQQTQVASGRLLGEHWHLLDECVWGKPFQCSWGPFKTWAISTLMGIMAGVCTSSECDETRKSIAYGKMAGWRGKGQQDLEQEEL